MNIEKIPEIIKRISDAKSKSYWICPNIEDTDEFPCTSVEERFDYLKEFFDSKVAMLHGKMNSQTKIEVMNQFHQGEITLLVSTTVIEVGVDVPDATIMVIENAERFGLAQLHQLRGRVGRGAEQSYCVLLYDQLSSSARKRLSALRRSNDGFFIAEQDMKIRGEGDLIGTKQSGLPNFKFADIWNHKDLAHESSEQAKEIINNSSCNDDSMRLLLSIFSYNERLVSIE